MREFKSYILVFFSLPIVWLVGTSISELPSSILPPPQMVVELLWEERSSLLGHTIATLKVAIIGYFISNLIAVGLAVSFLLTVF